VAEKGVLESSFQQRGRAKGSAGERNLGIGELHESGTPSARGRVRNYKKGKTKKRPEMKQKEVLSKYSPCLTGESAHDIRVENSQGGDVSVNHNKTD